MMRTETQETVRPGPFSGLPVCPPPPELLSEQVLLLRRPAQLQPVLLPEWPGQLQSCPCWVPATTINWLTGAKTGANQDLTSL